MNYSVNVSKAFDDTSFGSTIYNVIVTDEEFRRLYVILFNYVDDTVKVLNTSEYNPCIDEAIQDSKYEVVALQALQAFLEDV